MSSKKAEAFAFAWKPRRCPHNLSRGSANKIAKKAGVLQDLAAQLQTGTAAASVEQALASLNSEVLEQESALEEAGGDPLSPAALAADVAIAGHARTTMLALAELEAAGRQLQAGGPAKDAP